MNKSRLPMRAGNIKYKEHFMKKKLAAVLLLSMMCVFYAASQEKDAASLADSGAEQRVTTAVRESKTPLSLFWKVIGGVLTKMSDTIDTENVGASLAPYILIALGILILARIVSKCTSCVIFAGAPDLLLTFLPVAALFTIYYFGKGNVHDTLWANALFVIAFLLPAVMSVTTNLKCSRMPWAILYSLISIVTKLVTIIAVPVLIIAFFTIFNKGEKDGRRKFGRKFDFSQKFLLVVIGAISVFLIGGLVKSPRPAANSGGGAKPRRKWTKKQVSLLLCIFLGWLGVHRFYNKKYLTGVLMLLTLGGVGIWVIIDIILICTGHFTGESKKE
jgi:hypothetical protein